MNRAVAALYGLDPLLRSSLWQLRSIRNYAAREVFDCENGAVTWPDIASATISRSVC